jgi:pimeloyl-ACP methyl ester carboxylesterase
VVTSANTEALEPFEVRVAEQVLDDLRSRLGRTRWPEQPADEGWELGVDVAYLRELCEYWANQYDWRAFESRLNGLGNRRWNGLHLIWERSGGDGLPVMLIHGWPGGPIEFCDLIPLLVEAGHDVVVPSLPGYGWSDDPGRPLNVAAVSERLRAVMEAGLGYERYAVQGGDWGANISARMALDSPDTVAAVHVNAVSVLPIPGDLTEPPLSEAEQAYAETGSRWPRREGFHLFLHSAAPDAVGVAFNDSPAGLAAWLVEKYRRWSDCDGEVERRFSKDQLCDFLTTYWATGTIASSMRLYLGERRDRWRLDPGERIEVPAAAADFPAEIVRAPREWAERIFSDLRRWTEMPRGGHFAAFEEPELLADDVLGFLSSV